jgi:hypothetical protein
MAQMARSRWRAALTPFAACAALVLRPARAGTLSRAAAARGVARAHQYQRWREGGAEERNRHSESNDISRAAAHAAAQRATGWRKRNGVAPARRRRKSAKAPGGPRRKALKNRRGEGVKWRDEVCETASKRHRRAWRRRRRNNNHEEAACELKLPPFLCLRGVWRIGGGETAKKIMKKAA